MGGGREGKRRLVSPAPRSGGSGGLASSSSAVGCIARCCCLARAVPLALWLLSIFRLWVFRLWLQRGGENKSNHIYSHRLCCCCCCCCRRYFLQLLHGDGCLAACRHPLHPTRRPSTTVPTSTHPFPLLHLPIFLLQCSNHICLLCCFSPLPPLVNAHRLGSLSTQNSALTGTRPQAPPP